MNNVLFNALKYGNMIVCVLAFVLAIKDGTSVAWLAFMGWAMAVYLFTQGELLGQEMTELETYLYLTQDDDDHDDDA